MDAPRFVFPLRKNTYRVIDGDNVEVLLDRGWNDRRLTNLRLFGLNAPEKRTRRVEEKKAALLVRDVISRWILRREDSKVFYASSDKKSKYEGRTIGRFWADDLEDCLNHYLLQLAVVKPYHGGKRPEWTDEELAAITARCREVLEPEAEPEDDHPATG